MTMHAIANAVNASSAATLRAKCHASAAHAVGMAVAAFPTHANAVRKSYYAALLTCHGSFHIACEQITSEHFAAIKALGICSANAG